jgi:hypothetical protein
MGVDAAGGEEVGMPEDAGDAAVGEGASAPPTHVVLGERPVQSAAMAPTRSRRPHG